MFVSLFVFKQPILGCYYKYSGLPKWLSGKKKKKSTCQCRRHRRCEFNPWIRKIPWRRKWQATPIILPGKSNGWRSLVGCSPRSCQELDTTEQVSTHGYLIGGYVGIIYDSMILLISTLNRELWKRLLFIPISKEGNAK